LWSVATKELGGGHGRSWELLWVEMRRWFDGKGLMVVLVASDFGQHLRVHRSTSMSLLRSTSCCLTHDEVLASGQLQPLGVRRRDKATRPDEVSGTRSYATSATRTSSRLLAWLKLVQHSLAFVYHIPLFAILDFSTWSLPIYSGCLIAIVAGHLACLPTAHIAYEHISDRTLAS
jgi:hypothetical protein